MRRGYLTAPVIIILALITLAVAFVIFFNTNLIKQAKNQSEPQIQTQSTPSAAPSASPVTDSDVQLRGDKYNVTSKLCDVSFEFNQPSPTGSNWEFEEFQSNYSSIFENTARLYVRGDPIRPKFEVHCAENKENLNLDQLFSKFKTKTESNFGRLGAKTLAEVEGLPSYKVKMLEEVELEKPYDFHLVVAKGKIFLIRGLSDSDEKFVAIFDQILSTLKFLE